MKKHVLSAIFTLIFSAYAMAGTVCINGNCVNGGNGPVEIRQHNGTSECIGSGCGALETKRYQNNTLRNANEEWQPRKNWARRTPQHRNLFSDMSTNNESSLDINNYPPPPPGKLYAYTVGNGDTLSDIASWSNCSVDDLVIINRKKFPNFSKNDLFVGQKVFLCWYDAINQRPREIRFIE